MVLQPKLEVLDLAEWGQSNRNCIDQCLHQYGAILFRNFSIPAIDTFQKFLTDVAGKLIEYQYRSTPRSPVNGLLYSSTEYPADQSIPLHNEESYSRRWPMRLGFHCVRPPDAQGETPLADSRRVYAKLPDGLRQRFAEKQILYVRNYGTGLDLSWEEVFQTTQKSKVEAYCHQEGISFEWQGEHALRTWQICPAVATHPHTREPLWFNQAHLFHITNLPKHIREDLLDCMAEEDLPRQAYYGDGTPIEWEALDEIRSIYQEETVLFLWQKGDVLLVDNMLVAHGRSSFSGTRQIVVGMASPHG
ncbi:MAG: TauD/TfdA family dioxygenase [Nitrospirales bacterium]